MKSLRALDGPFCGLVANHFWHFIPTHPFFNEEPKNRTARPQETLTYDHDARSLNPGGALSAGNMRAAFRQHNPDLTTTHSVLAPKTHPAIAAVRPRTMSFRRPRAFSWRFTHRKHAAHAYSILTLLSLSLIALLDRVY